MFKANENVILKANENYLFLDFQLLVHLAQTVYHLLLMIFGSLPKKLQTVRISVYR